MATLPSPARTIVVPPDPHSDDLVWHVRGQPGEVLDYALDLSKLIDPLDTLASATAAVSPSGTGQRQITQFLVAADNLAIIWQTGGYPGQRYLFKLTFTTFSGRTFELVPALPISRVLEASFPPEPTAGFGTPVLWFLPALNFSQRGNAFQRLFGWS